MIMTGTTIFAEMTTLAEQTGAINLGQGFPDGDGPTRMLDVARQAIAAGHNQYPPLSGVLALRETIASQRVQRHGTVYDPADEVLVTAGATEAITAAVLALCQPGDEVVVFEPFYDLYAAAIKMAGAVLRSVLLRPEATAFRFNEADLAVMIGPRTRLLLLNTPHNPTGRVFTATELAIIARVSQAHDLVVLTDEVYEYLCFDGVEHCSIAALPGMVERTLTVSSAGKTFDATGWKIGWLCGPARLVAPVRRVKQYLTFASGTPFQHAVAVALNECENWIEGLRDRMQHCRDILAGGLAAAGVHTFSCQGTYFLQVDARSFGYQDGQQLCRALPELAGVVGVPSVAFFDSTDVGKPLVRFAFCKQTEVIFEAVERLDLFARREQKSR